jgi:hypothetical protein
MQNVMENTPSHTPPRNSPRFCMDARVHFSAVVGNQPGAAVTRDLSLSGVYVHTATRVPSAGEVLHLSLRCSDEIVRACGIVRRADGDGFAVQFTALDRDSARKLRGLLAAVA